MNENSRKKRDANIIQNCGKCAHKDVCQFKEIYEAVVCRVLHEAQADDYLIDVSIKCKYFNEYERMR